MIETIAEHSVDLELLPPRANILDLGCRGFLFADALAEKGHNVVCVDVDDLGTGKKYYRAGISNYDGSCDVRHNAGDPQASTLVKAGGLQCYTLESFSRHVGIGFWDLIKIDVEGSEYEIIMSLSKAPAKQISIEFHLHTKIYGGGAVGEMVAHLQGLGYGLLSHPYTTQHGAGFNFWDSLFILNT